ncbi:hypothetical protein EAE96_009496 [Botrytis aclada]|nr:hypothetical protein EAE96_009496 [Botrytis aclada]
MSTSRWMPVEDRKVIGDLDRLKRDMRSWAKKAATVTNMRDVGKSLDRSSLLALQNALRSVVYFEDDRLPSSLSLSKKASGLLLNALLSHNVYTTLFQSPFFFLPDRIVEGQSKKSESRLGLEEVYDNALFSNQEDAHVWRSQTLRLLLPSIVTGFSQAEEELHKMTEDAIAKVADQEASKFLAGPARHLIADGLRDKIYAIHREAATISYNLWTRRTEMKCWTLKDLGCPSFDPDGKYMTPHSSVAYENYDDQLKGRSISVIVHPLVAVCGTDEGKDYDQERVWVPAEVWLDSSISSGN